MKSSIDSLSPFMRTWSGNKVFFENVDKRSISIIDIAHALSLQCRFNGHCSEHYSVAEHSMRVSGKVLARTGDPRKAMAGLLHDAAEAYTGDVISPLKRILPGFKEIERVLEKCIAEVFDLVYPFPEEVHTADKDILDYEFRVIAPFGSLDDCVKSLSPKKAEKQFLDMYYKLAETILENDNKD